MQALRAWGVWRGRDEAHCTASVLYISVVACRRSRQPKALWSGAREWQECVSNADVLISAGRCVPAAAPTGGRLRLLGPPRRLPRLLMPPETAPGAIASRGWREVSGREVREAWLWRSSLEEPLGAIVDAEIEAQRTRG